MIEAAHRYRRKVLLASTSEIYGKNSAGPLHEESERILGSPAVVRWTYSTAKAVDEILANAYHRERGLPTIIVRLFNTVGPRQSPAYGMVIPRLIRQALQGDPVTVFGDGRQTRCFAHVADVVAAMLLLLDEEAAVGQTFNVGSSNEISILDLAKLIIARCNSASAIELIPYDQAYESGFEDMERRVPDTAKLRSHTGWAVRRSLDEILEETIAEAASEMAEIFRAWCARDHSGQHHRCYRRGWLWRSSSSRCSPRPCEGSRSGIAWLTSHELTGFTSSPLPTSAGSRSRAAHWRRPREWPIRRRPGAGHIRRWHSGIHSWPDR